MGIRRINTCVEEDLWKQAQFNNISWADAIETGLRLILGNAGERRELEKKVSDLDIKLRYYQEKLKEVVEVEKKHVAKELKTKADQDAIKNFLKENAGTLKLAKKKFDQEPTISSVYPYWETLNHRYTKRFNSSFDQKEFMKILEAMK